MSKSALFLIVSLSWLAAVAGYDLNDIEQNAIGCIQHSYESGGSKAGQFQIDCGDSQAGDLRQLSIKQTFKHIWISSGHGGWNKLPWFKEGGPCKSKNSDPSFLKGSIVCATKLLVAHCGTETNETEKGKNIKALIDVVTPKANACNSLHALTELQVKALEFIRASVAALEEGTRRVGSVEVSCKSGKLDSLKVSFVRTNAEKALTLKADLLDLLKGQRVLQCATRMLEQKCGNQAAESTDNNVYTNLVEMATPTEKPVCV